MRPVIFLAVAVVAASDEALAGETKNATPEVTKEEKAWQFYATSTSTHVPNVQEYVPIFRADRGWLHLEARYNYENLETGSVWIGYNFGGGKKLKWKFTPMLAGVFGDTTGIAPGSRLLFSYGKLDLSSVSEFVFDNRDSERSFFYNWTELSISPVDWFRFGLVGDCTRAYQTDVNIRRGILVGFTCKKVDFTTYVFNLDQGKPTWMFAAGVTF